MIDDYDLMDKDWDEFIRRGLQELTEEHPGQWDNNRREREQWASQVRAS